MRVLFFGMVKSRENLIGAYGFSIGVFLAVVIGLFNNNVFSQANEVLYSALVIIGLLVGFSNGTDRNSVTFLFASLCLVVIGALGVQPLVFIAKTNIIVSKMSSILVSLMVLFLPVTIIVALKTVFSQARV